MRTFSGLPLAVVVAALGVVPRLGAARRVPSALRAAEKLIGQARRNISHTRRSSFRLAPLAACTTMPCIAVATKRARVAGSEPAGRSPSAIARRKRRPKPGDADRGAVPGASRTPRLLRSPLAAHLRRAGSDAAAEQDPEWPGTSLDGCKQHEAMEWAFVVAECHTQGTYRATDTPRRRRRQPAWRRRPRSRRCSQA